MDKAKRKRKTVEQSLVPSLSSLLPALKETPAPRTRKRNSNDPNGQYPNATVRIAVHSVASFKRIASHMKTVAEKWTWDFQPDVFQSSHLILQNTGYMRLRFRPAAFESYFVKFPVTVFMPTIEFEKSIKDVSDQSSMGIVYDDRKADEIRFLLSDGGLRNEEIIQPDEKSEDCYPDFPTSDWKFKVTMNASILLRMFKKLLSREAEELSLIISADSFRFEAKLDKGSSTMHVRGVSEQEFAKRHMPKDGSVAVVEEQEEEEDDGMLARIESLDPSMSGIEVKFGTAYLRKILFDKVSHDACMRVSKDMIWILYEVPSEKLRRGSVEGEVAADWDLILVVRNQDNVESPATASTGTDTPSSSSSSSSIQHSDNNLMAPVTASNTVEEKVAEAIPTMAATEVDTFLAEDSLAEDPFELLGSSPEAVAEVAQNSDYTSVAEEPLPNPFADWQQQPTTESPTTTTTLPPQEKPEHKKAVAKPFIRKAKVFARKA